MPSAAYSLVRQTILKKENVRATYHGHIRDMSPHTLGTKEGLEKALMYQFAGGSNSGLGPLGSGENWRCLFLNELSNVSVIGGEWHTAPTHSQEQTCVDEVDVEVSH